MSMSQSLEVVVVGGGLGGLTAALAMRQQGLRVTVLEQEPPRRRPTGPPAGSASATGVHQVQPPS